MRGKITNIIESTREEGVATFLESESFQSLITKAASQILSSTAAPLLGSIIGAAAPMINGVILTYRQNRLQKNTLRLIEELTARVDNHENNYVSLSPEMKEQYHGLYVEMLLDNVIDERQEEKVRWNVNGFINMMTNESNENIMQLFFDTLAEVTVLDINTLRMYTLNSDIDWQTINQKYGIDLEHLKLIKEKLVRLGLLYRKNDSLRDNNIDQIAEYLKKVDSASRNCRSKDVKYPNTIKRISNSEIYEITNLGKDFLKSISDPV